LRGGLGRDGFVSEPGAPGNQNRDQQNREQKNIFHFESPTIEVLPKPWLPCSFHRKNFFLWNIACQFEARETLRVECGEFIAAGKRIFPMVIQFLKTIQSRSERKKRTNWFIMWPLTGRVIRGDKNFIFCVSV
jgi:hypothetical protein